MRKEKTNMTTQNNAQDGLLFTPARRRRRWTWLVLAVSLGLGGGAYSVARAAGDVAEMGPGGMHGRMHARMDKILTAAGATDGQRAQIKSIWQGLRPQLKAAHQEHFKIRQQIQQALAAPNIDPAAIEKLRQQSLQSMDKTSALITQGMVSTAQVLSPDQRQKALTAIQSHQMQQQQQQQPDEP
jgi:Spy/CpxP family protein refolding chaperone